MRTLLLCLALALTASTASAQILVSGDITSNTTWTSNNEYILVGRVYVTNNALLTIQPGTVIRGRFNADPAQASALVITQGARINANGQPFNPIIFTAEADDLTSNTDLGPNDRGLWGGLILLGRATTNNQNPQIRTVEGLPQNDPRGQYGCDNQAVTCNDADNSGVVRFVSIRHSGALVTANNEINGLTMGGVGTGTLIENVEVFANADDGFEFFGGTVNTRFLFSSYNDDDNFDYDEGTRGCHQFWFALQGGTFGDSGGEWDGDLPATGLAPFSDPTIFNATFVGSGATSGRTGNEALNIRDWAAGDVRNSIFTDFGGDAVTVDNNPNGSDSYGQLTSNVLTLTNNIFFGFGAGPNASDFFDLLPSATPQEGAFETYMTTNNEVVNPLLAGISRTNNNVMNPRPTAPEALTNVAPLFPGCGAALSAAAYRGAFNPTFDVLWPSGWTFSHRANYLRNYNISITLSPTTSTTLPAAGGTIKYRGTVRNNDTVPVTLQAWGTYTQPTNARVVLAPSAPFTLAPGERLTVRGRIVIRDVQPTGTYTFWQVAGIHPNGSEAVGSFTFEKLAIAAGENEPEARLSLETYPNPFNPTTQLAFELPEAGNVQLTVFDVMGREVARLADGELAAGFQQFTFDGTSLASGVYFARLATAGQVLTQRLTLIK